MNNLQQELAVFIHSVRFDDFSDTVIEKAKRHLLDTLGAALAGTCSEIYQTVLNTYRDELQGTSQLWGQPYRTSPRNAAFLNGVITHMYELDDTGGCDHSGAVIIPAILAILPQCQQPVSGQQLLTALIIGYEVGRRVLEACGGYSAHNGKGWHSTATCGVFGAAAAAGMLLHLSSEQINSALGIAGSYSSGLWAFIHDGAQTKKLHAGIAAQHGVSAALLAQAGLQGPGQLFEPVWGGFFHAYAEQTQKPAALTAQWGHPWKIERCSIKPYASCRSVHSSIDAIRTLLDRMTLNTPSQIERVNVYLSTFLQGMCGVTDLSSLAGAQMSLPYALCACILYGRADLSVYQPEKLHHPDVADVLQKIHLVIDTEQTADSEPVIEMVSIDGRAERCQVTVALGAPANPLSDKALFDKFTSLANTALSTEKTEKLLNCCLSIEQQNDCQTLVDLLTVAA